MHHSKTTHHSKIAFSTLSWISKLLHLYHQNAPNTLSALSLVISFSPLLFVFLSTYLVFSVLQSEVNGLSSFVVTDFLALFFYLQLLREFTSYLFFSLCLFHLTWCSLVSLKLQQTIEFHLFSWYMHSILLCLYTTISLFIDLWLTLDCFNILVIILNTVANTAVHKIFESCFCGIRIDVKKKNN